MADDAANAPALVATAAAGAVRAALPAQSPERSLIERWHGYYTEKRIVHQWLQVHLLAGLPVKRVLEVGPHLGLVSAMLASAGYEVTTLDIGPDAPRIGPMAHIQADLTRLDPARIRGHDAILCCETLDHLPWAEIGGVLAAFAASGAPYLAMSVPYEGAQIGWSFYANGHTARHRLFTRWLRFVQTFKVKSPADIGTHKWEVGYRGYSLAALEAKVAESGWRPVERRFTEGCRSVFLVCRNSDVR